MTTTEAPRYAGQLDKAIPIEYDVFQTGLSELPRLSAAQCRQLLEGVVEPNLREMRAWAKQLVEMRKPLEAELKTFEKRRLTDREQERRRQVQTSLRQIHDGLAHDGLIEGVAETDAKLLKPLMHLPDVQVGKPGQFETAKIIGKLERDREYLAAYLRRWPAAEATQPYRLSPKRNAPEFDSDGEEIEPGAVVKLTEANARSLVNIYEPVDVDPVIKRYIKDLRTVDLSAESRF